MSKTLIYRHKKTGQCPVLESVFASSRGVSSGVGERSLGRLDAAQGFTHNLLGNTGTLATLGAYARGSAYFPVTAAAVIDCFTNMTVGNTLAKTDVHMNTR